MEQSTNLLRFQVGELEYILTLLTNLKLVDYASRMRTRFWKLIATRFEQYREEYGELIKEHSELDENGEPKSALLDNGSRRYEIKNMTAFQEALKPLVNEDFVIQIDDNNKNMIKSVAKSIFNCGIEFQGQDAFNYDALCERFEQAGFGGDNNED